jgi:REP element-mobilizing transposase RayT
LKTPTIRDNVIIDEWVIMPNHIHLIIRILPAINETTDNVTKNGTMANGTTKPVETHRGASLPVACPVTGTYHGGTYHGGTYHAEKNHFGPQSDNLPAIVRGFKSAVKRDTNKYGLKFHWQPRYHDHMIRDDKALCRIKRYIRKNIESWYKDSQNR